MAEGVFDKIIAVTDKETKCKAVEHAKAYILGNWSGIMLSIKSIRQLLIRDTLPDRFLPNHHSLCRLVKDFVSILSHL